MKQLFCVKITRLGGESYFYLYANDLSRAIAMVIMIVGDMNALSSVTITAERKPIA